MRSPDDVFTTSDQNFYFEMNHYFFTFILILQQIKPALVYCKNPLDYMKVLFLLYANEYTLLDSLPVWQTNYYLFTPLQPLSTTFVFDKNKFLPFLQRSFIADIMGDFINCTLQQIRLEILLDILSGKVKKM